MLTFVSYLTFVFKRFPLFLKFEKPLAKHFPTPPAGFSVYLWIPMATHSLELALQALRILDSPGLPQATHGGQDFLQFLSTVPSTSQPRCSFKLPAPAQRLF